MGMTDRVKSVIKRPLYADDKTLMAAIGSARVVSFDLYDTLIKRDVPFPAQVHQLVSRDYARLYGKEIGNYTQLRLEAERLARKMTHEPNLTEIFDHLDLPNEIKTILQELERETEIKIACANPNMQKFYQSAIRNGKTIVVTTDMYLPVSALQTILTRNGYTKVDRIYLSAQHRKSKADGRLFDVLLADCLAAPGEIVHIGDSLRGDFSNPRKMGIHAFLIPRQLNNLEYRRCRDVEKRTLRQAAFDQFISNRIPPEATEEMHIGYEVLGPMLLGYCSWLHDKMHQDTIEKVFFLSREGKILQEAYNILFPDEVIPQQYFYASRRALLVPLISQTNSYSEMIKLLRACSRDLSLRVIGYICGFDMATFEAELAAAGLTLDVPTHTLDAAEQASAFQIVKRLGNSFFVEQYQLVRQYLQQCGMQGKAALADTGWAGTMQKVLLRYLLPGKATLSGYYFSVRDLEKTPKTLLRREGCFSEPGKNERYDHLFRFSIETIEMLLQGRDGTVEKYRLDMDGRVVPVLAATEYDDTAESFIKIVQSSALDFLYVCMRDKGSGQVPLLSPELALEGYIRFAGYPDASTIRRFESFSFFNGTKYPVIPDKNAGFYLFHPKLFVAEFNRSGSKILLLKKLFKLSLPYFDILYFMAYKLRIRSPYRKKYYGDKETCKEYDKFGHEFGAERLSDCNAMLKDGTKREIQG